MHSVDQQQQLKHARKTLRDIIKRGQPAIQPQFAQQLQLNTSIHRELVETCNKMKTVGKRYDVKLIYNLLSHYC
jgi:hypothetical protein